MSIVVGFIQNKESEAALSRAITEARLRKARLLVVHSSKGGQDEDADDVIACRERLEEIRKRLAHEGLDHEVTELVRGNTPAEDLVAIAKETDAEMIVIGIRRRSAVGKMILGSNAQQILLAANCPVLTVKATDA